MGEEDDIPPPQLAAVLEELVDYGDSLTIKQAQALADGWARVVFERHTPEEIAQLDATARELGKQDWMSFSRLLYRRAFESLVDNPEWREHMAHPISFSEWVRTRRRDLGLSRADVAARMGRTAAIVGAMERGQVPRDPEKRGLLAAALEVSVGEVDRRADATTLKYR